MKNIKNYLKFYWIGILISLTFFIAGLLTVSHYGINIDEPIHFERGNAYLDFFLTGREKYTAQDFTHPRTSEWKYRGYDAAHFIKNDSGHPPLNGILAAATNRVFYEKLGILGDLEGYHVFEIFVSSSLVFLVYAMIRRKYGIFAAIFASASLVLYPLFLGESHYNVKDPVEATFFAFTIFFFYLTIEKKKGIYLFLSSIFFALAFGTKFNILFLPFILFPYLIVRYHPIFNKFNLKNIKHIPVGIYIALVLYPIIVLGVQLASRPYLWQDPINRFLKIVYYYQDIGTGALYQPTYNFNGFNLYPPFFVGISTPLVILFFFIFGVFASLILFKKEKDKFSFLLLLWFLVPVVRVMWPGASIYSGVRQIMEYVPAMAALSAVGALFVKDFLSKKLKGRSSAISLALILSLAPLAVTLFRLHPNEAVYINSLVGGLKGAVEKQIPGAGETMGNAYLQGLEWLNVNAEKNARYHLPVGLASNIPLQFARADLKLGNFFSGMLRSGEYMIEMTSVDFPPPRYNFRYLDAFIEPVYESKVDGVPVVKVWKNDAAHTRKGFLNEEEEKIAKVTKDSSSITVELDKPTYATRIIIEHDDSSCIPEGLGTVSYSLNSSGEFLSPDDLFRTQGAYATSLNTSSKYVYLFTAVALKKIIITPEDSNICFLKYKGVTVFGLKDIKPAL